MKRLSPLIPRLRRGSSRSLSPRPPKEKYDYEALFHDDYVRVCRILPAAGDRPPKNQPLECELIEVPIHGCPLTYECLSYTWGDPTRSHAVTCGGKNISITKTLHTVLVLLRPSEGSRDLWIDQICINQEDMPERGRQVQMMADIYRNAGHVIVWLGEGGKDSDLALHYAGQIAAAGNKGDSAGVDDKFLEQHGLPTTGSKSWTALGAILQRPWFSRAWVVQELAVAKGATLFCGNSSIDFIGFTRALVRLKAGASRHFGANLYHNGSPGERAVWMQTLRTHNGRADPFKVFTFTKNCDASNDADKLFAFTSLANFKITTDYLRSVEEIYTTFAHSYITRALKGYKGTFSPQEGRQSSARVIAGFLCNAGKLSQRYPNLPSWVPDWSFRQNTKPFWTFKTMPGRKSAYNAGGDELGDCEFDHSRGLHVSVMMIDAVARVGGSVDLTNARDWSGKQLQQACSAWFTEASAINFSSGWGNTPYMNGETRNEALMRTLVADVDTGNQRATVEYAQSYFKYFLNYIYEQTQLVLFSAVKTDHVRERYAFGVASIILGRSFFVTQQGFIGLGPYGMKAGDEVAVMLGSDIPFLVRRKGEGLQGPEYELLGECFLHGVMFGEVWGLGCPVQRIVLK